MSTETYSFTIEVADLILAFLGIILFAMLDVVGWSDIDVTSSVGRFLLHCVVVLFLTCFICNIERKRPETSSFNWMIVNVLFVVSIACGALEMPVWERFCLFSASGVYLLPFAGIMTKADPQPE